LFYTDQYDDRLVGTKPRVFESVLCTLQDNPLLAKLSVYASVY